MPFKRSSGSSRAGKRSNRHTSSKRSSAISKTLATRVASLEKKVKAEVHNWKYIYTPTTTLTNDLRLANPFLNAMNVVPTGLTETNQRIGDRLKFHYMEGNFHFFRLSPNVLPPVTCRMLIVRETSALGSVISPAGLFNSASPDPVDTFNQTTRDHSRYHILWDEVFILGANVSQAIGGAQGNPNPCSEKYIKVSIPLNFITDYSRGVAGTVADIETNTLNFVAITEGTTANDINIKASVILKFLDA